MAEHLVHHATRQDGEEFEYYVERFNQAFADWLDRKVGSMAIDIAGLEVEEQVLATVIPELANDIHTLQDEKGKEEEALKAKIEELEKREGELAADSAELASVKRELATAQGELAQVEAVREKLAPVVEEAEKIAPAPAPAPPPGAEGGGTAVDPGQGSNPAGG